MILLKVNIQLTNFDEWWNATWGSSYKSVALEHGVTPQRVLKNDDDESQIIVVMTAPNMENFEKLRTDERIQSTMKNLEGNVVTSRKPSYYTVEQIAEQSDGNNYGFHVEHKLVDYDKWFNVFSGSSDRLAVEAEVGIKCIRVLRSLDDQNSAIVVLQGPDQSAMDRMHNHPSVLARFSDTTLFAQTPRVLGRYTSTAL